MGLGKKRIVGSPVPWRRWNLDKAFFRSLSHYTIDHPETTLKHVLEGVSAGLESNKDMFLLIPNSPFPARDFIQALAHLIKLGITIARAKATVQTFANQVVNWVLDIKSAFEASEVNRFTWTTWRNLAKMRDLVDEVCTWAVVRLNDKRWNRIANGMKISGEIAEFNSRIAEAKELFKDLSIINLSGGIGAIYGAIKLLLNRQTIISREILKIRETQLEQLAHIMDEMEAQRQAEQRRHFFSETLLPRTVTNPTYDQQGKNPCDADTRIEVLAEIMRWIHDVSPQSQNFLWLTGDPGCGKSAITASIARDCKDDGILWAQFFINSNNVETTDPNSYFPSIARQLADHSLEVERAIYDTLKKQPSLMDSISPDQAAKLFLAAIGVASELDPHKPVVVVIDALDETERTRLKDTATIFSHLLKGLSGYRNAKVFISSRTEDDIRNPFARHMKDKHVKHIHLDTSAQSSIDDVSAFLRRKVEQIVEENGLNWTAWPGEERMAILANQASGLFIWAVTVAKFLQEQIDTLGSECLNDVLNMFTAEDLGDINTLYTIILCQTYKHKSKNDWEFEKFRRIVGAIVVLREPLKLQDLRRLLDIRQTAISNPVDVVNFVRRLRTVLVAGANTVDDDTVPRLHKSFYDFVTSGEVPTQFRVDPKTSETELASRCLSRLALPHVDRAALQPLVEDATDRALPAHLRYATRFWSSHLRQAKDTTSGMVFQNERLRSLGLNKLLLAYARPNLNNDHLFGPLNITLPSDRAQVTISTTDEYHVWDSVTGQKRSILLQGHADAVTSVAFSPNGKHLISASLDNTLILWDLETARPIGMPFQGHTGAVYAVAFSPTGTLIASGSEDHTVRVWSTREPRLIATLTGHTGPVHSVAFSNKGDEILSGSEDHTVRRWSWRADLGSLIGAPLNGHTDSVRCVAYSRDGRWLMSGSLDGTIRLWTHDGQLVEPPVSHTSGVWSIDVSPGGRQVVSSHGDGSVLLWQMNQGRLERTPTRHRSQTETRNVHSVAFSPDGETMVLGSEAKTIHVVDARIRHRAQERLSLSFVGHTHSVLSVAFSPDGTRVASGSKDNTVRIWDVPGAKSPRSSAPKRETKLTAISPDGNALVSVLMDQTALLWDLRAGAPSVHRLQVSGDLNCVAFSSDGTRIAGASYDGRQACMYLWATTTRQLIASHTGLPYVDALFFAPDKDAFCVTFELSLKSSAAWNRMMRDGKVVLDPAPAEESSVDDYEEEGTELDDLHYFRPKVPGSQGLWVILDHCLIRAREEREGSAMTVIADPLARWALSYQSRER